MTALLRSISETLFSSSYAWQLMMNGVLIVIHELISLLKHTFSHTHIHSKELQQLHG